MNYHIAIFSYNRGPYLRNCIESVRRHCPEIPFTVYDDGSDQKDLLNYLASLGDSVRYMKNAKNERHGGFYYNMQAALNETKADVLILLQDDVQVVRDINIHDFQAWQLFWKNHSDCAFLSPVFMKGSRRDDFKKYYQPDILNRVYHWVECYKNSSKDGPVPHYYMDVCLLHVDRLRKANWHYQSSEWLNGQQAKQNFAHGMAQLADPFVFYVPEEPVYRDRVKTRGTRMAERLSGNVVKSFKGMSPSEVYRMKGRDIGIYPFAEDFIQTEDVFVQRPYRFNVYRTHWLSRLMNKLEKLWVR